MSEARASQSEMILKHMMDCGSITTWEAYEDYGCTRLPSRICDLKKQGYAIGKTMVTKKNRYGRNVSFAKYTLGGNG